MYFSNTHVFRNNFYCISPLRRAIGTAAPHASSGWPLSSCSYFTAPRVAPLHRGQQGQVRARLIELNTSWNCRVPKTIQIPFLKTHAFSSCNLPLQCWNSHSRGYKILLILEGLTLVSITISMISLRHISCFS
jgi:hypothetical protein